MASSCCMFEWSTLHSILDEIIALSGWRTAIREMESKSDKDAWKDAIDCFKETKDRLELKLSRLTQLADENFDGVKELKVHGKCIQEGCISGGRLLLSSKIMILQEGCISGGRLFLFYTYQSIPYISSVVISSAAVIIFLKQ
ncbi:hypothetical protein Tco_0987329 [Tanacetum coccineum]